MVDPASISEQPIPVQGALRRRIDRLPLQAKAAGIAMMPAVLVALAVGVWIYSQGLAAHAVPFLLIASVGLAVGALIVWALIAELLRPIAEMAELAGRVEQGQLGEHAAIQADDDLGELSRRFNAIIDGLATTRSVQEALIDRLRQRNEELSALYDLAGMASQSFNTEYVLNNGLARMLELVEADAGMIALFDENHEALALNAEHNVPPSLVTDKYLYCTDGGLVCQVLESGRPLLVENVQTGTVAMPEAFVEKIVEAGYHSLFIVPVLVRGEMLGVLNTFGGRLSLGDDRLSLLVAVCNQLGIAIENARLWEEVRRKELIRTRLLAKTVSAQEQERLRISRELHDETGQALTTLLVQLTVTEELSDVEAIYEHIRKLRKTVSQTIEEVRRLALDLRPSTLDDLGLVPALEWYVEEYERNTGIAVRFNVDNMTDVRMPREAEVELYRVVQEALTNVARHAQASTVTLEVERRKNAVTIEIADDGHGFDAEEALSADTRSLGLLGMQERVELIGGQFALASAPGQGTHLLLTVPLR